MSTGIDRLEAAQHWIMSVLLNLVLPISPLLVEWAISGDVSVASAVLAASMYSISTGMVCRIGPILVISIIIAIFYIAMFGAVMYQITNKTAVAVGDFNALWTIGILFVTNVALKFWYHVIDLRPFTEFWLRSE
ncbi:hypothetical protein GIW50_12510 [Pseudomonas syringae]|uniref:Uncharacterized protein n=1 Tax=Pseudomonas syringae TaxID=317 RepID=A0A9Q3ZYF6_PSESX|nr:hypothetical protein [Pseudomonas syringae]MCF5064946.1 hypothetical protein [Pseudomonas syringae]MCF5074909.1 hypothetical protein [Pseudomonas syringae]MCF5119224.1 hypothetical protein [Pseudomonas syringae]MCF5379062.1 hypothetical protein [Pseudomonas syringae]